MSCEDISLSREILVKSGALVGFVCLMLHRLEIAFFGFSNYLNLLTVFDILQLFSDLRLALLCIVSSERSRSSMVKKAAKSKAKGTQQEELEILQVIDQRFEELEETVALASIVPQLHERLHAVEQMLKMQNKETQAPWKMGPQWGDEQSSPRKLAPPAPPAPPDDEFNSAGVKLEMNSSDVKVEQVEQVEQVKQVNHEERNISNLTDLTICTKPRSITKISERTKVKEMDEKTLDTQTMEYYSFGESTWDLVIFIGTGALGPFGSFQTILLAIVNVIMQIVFVAIAFYNFTSPDINDSSVVDSVRCVALGPQASQD